MPGMEHVGGALQSFLRSAGLDKAVARWRVVVEWRRIVGDEIADHAEALRFQRGVLWVAVSSSNWTQHITFLKPRLLEALRRELPGVRITDIRCVVRSARDGKRGGGRA